MQWPDVVPSTLGGDVAVDFFNTVQWRLDADRRREGLPGFPHLIVWMLRAGLLSDTEAQALALEVDAQPDAAAAEHARVLELRDDTYRALNDGDEPVVLQQQLPSAHASSRLRRSSDGVWTWMPVDLDLAVIRHRLALEFARLLTSESILRFHRCEDQHCGWVFLDTSRQHNRRWCSSADCGNRNRARMHYARSKAASPAER